MDSVVCVRDDATMSMRHSANRATRRRGSSPDRVARVAEISTGDRVGVRRFARMERRWLAGEPRFVAELDKDLERWLSRRSALTAGVESSLWVAYDGGTPVARCVALTQRRWQEHHDEPRTGFISHIALAEETPQEAGGSLLASAHGWLAERDVDRILAPYGHWLSSYLLRTDAFEEPPTFPFRWDPPRVGALLEGAGYRPVHPAWSYRIELGTDEWRRAADIALAAPRCRLRPLAKRHWARDLGSIADLFNRTFAEEWEYHPITPAEIRELYDPFKPLLDAELTLFAEIEGEPVGMCLAVPDFTAAQRRGRGRLGPASLVRFLVDARRVRHGSLFAVGVVPEQRGKGIGRALVGGVLRRFAELGAKTVDYHLVNDDNRTSRALAAAFGGQGRLLHHGFERHLDREPPGVTLDQH